MFGARHGSNEVPDQELWLAGVPFCGGIGTIECYPKRTPRTYLQYGGAPPLRDESTDGWELTLGGLTDGTAREIRKLARQEAPFALPAWSNTMDARHSKYVGSTYYGVWRPDLIRSEDWADAIRGHGRLTARCDSHYSPPGALIYGEKAPVTKCCANYTATLTNTPYRPNKYDHYALDLFFLSGNDPTESVQVQGGAVYVQHDGVVAVPQSVVGWPDRHTAPPFVFVVLMADAAAVGGCHLKQNLGVTYHDYWSPI